VIHLTAPNPNAALARNLGWRKARGQYILFLDGDTELAPDFISHALPNFKNPLVAVVCGKRQELFPNQSYYHRVLNLEWRLPEKPFPVCGGDALMRRDALAQVNGFDGELIAGEEPELCSRFHDKGLKVIPLPNLITQHDLNMTQFSQYWKRCFRTGYAYAKVSKKTGFLWTKEARHNRIKEALMLLALVFFPITFPLIGALILKTAIQTHHSKNTTWETAFAYGFHAHFQHIPMFFGQLTSIFKNQC